MKKTLGRLLALVTALTLIFTLLPDNLVIEAATYKKTYTVKLKPGQDATSAIQEALNKAAKAGTSKKQARVKVPAGTYYISNTLCIGSYTCLELNSKTVIKKKADPKIPFLYMLRCCSDSKNMKCVKGGYSDTKNITVKGGKWDAGFARYNSEMTGAQLSFTNTTNLKITNVTVCNNYASHLIELAGVKSCTISGCELYGFEADAKGTDKEAIQLDFCDEELVGNGGPYDDTPCTKITIKNCKFHDYPRAIGGHCIVEGMYHKDITITGNEFTDMEGYAVYGYNVADVTVKNNTFKEVGGAVMIKNCPRGASKSTRARQSGVKAMTISNHDYSIVISDNTINTAKVKAADISGSDSGESSKGRGIDIYAKEDDLIKNVTISGNTITADSCGIFLTNIKDVSVTGNTIDRSANAYDVTETKFVEEGIKLYGVTGTFSNNTVSGTNSAKYENGTALRDGTDVTVDGLTINPTAKNGIAVYSSTLTGSGSTVNGAAEHGIVVAYEGRINISDSTISNNGAKGISLTGESTANISDSSIFGNKNDTGINAMTGCKLEVNNCSIYSNGKHGIYTKEVPTTVKGCTIYSNGGYGICLYDSSYDITGCNIYTNAKKPMYFGGASSGTDSGNSY